MVCSTDKFNAMRDERREPGDDAVRQPGTNETANRDAILRINRGPFSTTVERLANAFNRSRVNKREADERRSRNM